MRLTRLQSVSHSSWLKRMWNANSANGKRNCESENWALSDCSVIGHTSGKGIFSSTNSVAMGNRAQYRELLITKDLCTVPESLTIYQPQSYAAFFFRFDSAFVRTTSDVSVSVEVCSSAPSGQVRQACTPWTYFMISGSCLSRNSM